MAKNGLKSNSVTDHCRIYKRILACLRINCLDGGSIPPRSTIGGSRGLVADYEMRNIPEVVIVMHTFLLYGPDWIRQQWKVRH